MHYINKLQYLIISIGAWPNFQFTFGYINIDRQKEAWILWFMWNWEQIEIERRPEMG